MINRNTSLITTYNKITPALKTFASISVKYLTITFVLEPGRTHFKVLILSRSVFSEYGQVERESQGREMGEELSFYVLTTIKVYEYMLCYFRMICLFYTP